MVRQVNEYHPIIGHRYIPEIRARIPHESGGYLVETNSSGFRCNHEFSKEKPDGIFRVLLFGDSFTAGDGVSNKFRFGDLLEKQIDGLQVLNFGLPGTGTDQQYLAYQNFGQELDFDLLLICPLVQNIKRVSSRYETVITRENGDIGYLAKPYYEMINQRLELRNVPVPKGVFSRQDLEKTDKLFYSQSLSRRIIGRIVNRYLYGLKNILQKTIAYNPVREYSSKNGAEWKLMKKVLEDWVRSVNDLPVIICPIPLYHHVEELASPSHYRERFAEFNCEPNVTVYDPLAKFLSESKETRRKCRFPLDQHFTPLGHAIMADALTPLITTFMKADQK